jgi:hypothetical protein
MELSVFAELIGVLCLGADAMIPHEVPVRKMTYAYSQQFRSERIRRLCERKLVG